MEEERSFATRTLSVVGLGLLAFAITILAGGIWTALLVTNLQSSPAVPWSVPAMALLLWLMSSYPLMTVALMTLMGSLVAPFMEEAGFRGYFQVALERELRGPVAVMVSSLVFAFAHYAHGILWPKLLVYFLAGIAFGMTAYLTNSTLPAILPHMIGDLTFFTLVWPHDAARRLVLESRDDIR